MVVLGSLIAVREHLVGLVDLFEFFFCAWVFVAVWMELHGLFAEGLTDVLFTNAPRHTENIVIIRVRHL